MSIDELLWAVAFHVGMTLLLIILIAVYKWVWLPREKRRLAQDEATRNFAAQSLDLMLADSEVARALYAKTHQAVSETQFTFLLAAITFIYGQLYFLLALASFASITLTMITSAPVFLLTAAFLWFGCRAAHKAEKYRLAILAYEKRKGVPSLP